MPGTIRRLIPEGIQKTFFSLLAPLVKALTKWKIHPNSLTLGGFVITCMAAVALYKGYLRTGGVLILLGGLCDSLDGNLARATGIANRSGALLDSVIDRYSEFIMFLGIAAYFIRMKNYFILVVTFIALCGSIMVSYTRARAESLGFESKAGMMQRAERIVFLGSGALFHPVAFKISIWLVAILANITALQRLRISYQQNKTKTNREEIITKT
ncbi:MAG: CDP-alcohol phosphatidyltransferase family protein [Deltaproteobacteria bacterium]|jgi:CDP-diacylglycerol--glycerol-3-phosphate 3-phosphatidyltransferase